MKKLQLIFGLIFLSFCFSANAQESNYLKDKDTIQTFDVLEVNGKFRKNLRLLDFLRKDSRFSNPQLAQLADKQVQSVGSTGNSRERNPGGSIPFVYLDGELIVSDGMNRLFLIQNLWMKDIKTIASKQVGFDKVIYITTL